MAAQWRCTVAGHEDVVVNNPREARDWLKEHELTGSWREYFKLEHEGG